MIILDTNAFGHIQKKDPFGVQIKAALARDADIETRITSISAYEVLKGAVSLITQQVKSRQDMIFSCRLLDTLVQELTDWERLILPYDGKADRVYQGFTPRLRQELRADAWIAAIALVHGATVWTRNVRDFVRIPYLAVVEATTGLPITRPTG